MPLQPGTPLGPYEILSPIGPGGMGEVYKARDTRLDRTVAIKVLPEHVASDPDLKQRAGQPFRAKDLGPFVEGQIRGHGFDSRLVHQISLAPRSEPVSDTADI